MFQMLVLIMFKTSRFWPLVLPDDDDANTIKVAYGHPRITHITRVGVYRVIKGCSALTALCLIHRCKSETQGQLSRCGGVIRPRFGLLHLDSRDNTIGGFPHFHSQSAPHVNMPRHSLQFQACCCCLVVEWRPPHSIYPLLLHAALNLQRIPFLKYIFDPLYLGKIFLFYISARLGEGLGTH